VVCQPSQSLQSLQACRANTFYKQNPNKDCDCAPLDLSFFHKEELSWPDQQQQLLASIDAFPTAGPAWCHHGGAPGPGGTRLPLEWCACGDDPMKPSVTYSVASGTEDPCPYTASQPGPTVTFSDRPVPSPPAPPAPSPTVGEVTCYPDPFALKCGPADVSPDRAKNSVNIFCTNNKDKHVKSGDPDLVGDGTESLLDDGTDYHVSVGWIPGCISSVSSQNVGEPLPDQKCDDLLGKAIKCK